MPFGDPSLIDTSLSSRAATFENPTGARGAGGSAGGGRKGAPSQAVAPGSTVTLLDVEGPGTVRHVWLTVPPAPPEVLRSLLFEAWWDGAASPSISVPVVDLFGCPHGRPVAFSTGLSAVQEGRGLNLHVPMPFRSHARFAFTNGSTRDVELYYQVDFTLQPSVPDDAGLLHVTWRRSDPTTLGDDFVIESVDGGGPGRFLGCNVGVRVLDEGAWYGEGEVKVFLDGDDPLPTICGTGLEDYVGTAWGMGAHSAPWSGAPLDVRDPAARRGQPSFVGFYRWHVPDPIVFTSSVRVTLQQLGFALFLEGQDEAFEAYSSTHPVGGRGWAMRPRPGVLAMGVAERVDDVCATAFTYLRSPQPVPPVDPALAVQHVERLPFEEPSPFEAMFAPLA